jgi:hypothetical protein
MQKGLVADRVIWLTVSVSDLATAAFRLVRGRVRVTTAA